MTKRRGFTLVELLVVIAIIALLMSILMPALARVRKQAKAVLCQSNLKQWGSVFAMYTGDHDSSFNTGPWFPHDERSKAGQWLDALEPYYQDMELAVCPEATKCWGYDDWPPYVGWCHLEAGIDWYQVEADEYGSYGLNYWATNPLEEKEWYEPGNYWRTINVKGAANIPLFLDSLWIGRWPHHTDWPPGNIYDYGGPPMPGMKDFCIDRHAGGTLNGLFMDFSVARIGLKQLWTFKWCVTYDVQGPWTLAGGADRHAWLSEAEWMADFKDY
jgi:prepilin-type N-terminal cleavage/methylation domain-containing protein